MFKKENKNRLLASWQKTRSQLWWRKEKSRRENECVARPERQMMSAKRIIHIHRIFLNTSFQRWRYMAKMDTFRSSTSRRFYSSMSSALCSLHFEDGCYEYMSLIKSGEDGQWIQLKRKLITGPVPTPDTIVSHSFPLPFCKRTMVSGTKHLVTGHFCPNLEKPS